MHTPVIKEAPGKVKSQGNVLKRKNKASESISKKPKVTSRSTNTHIHDQLSSSCDETEKK